MNNDKLKNKIKEVIKDYPEVCTLPVTTTLGASSTTGFDVLNSAIEDCADSIVNIGNTTSMLPVSSNNSSLDSQLSSAQSSSDLENLSATSQQGTTVGLLTLSCSLSGERQIRIDIDEDGKIRVEDVGSPNAVACDKIEQNAKKIYDKYNQNHDITLEGNSSMIIPDETTAKIVDEIIKDKTTEELLNDLMALREIISQNSASEVNQKKLK